MRNYMILIMPFMMGFTIVTTSRGNDSGNPITFTQARKIILATNGNIDAAAIEIKAAEAGVKQAAVLPNPEIAADFEHFGMNESEIALVQTIETGGKRHLRTESARIDVATATNGKAESYLDLEAEIINRFIPIVSARKKITLIDSMLSLAEATRDQIQIRVQAGASRQTDLTRAEIAVDKLQLERNSIRSTERQARTEFAALGGNDNHDLFNVTGTLETDTPVPPLEKLLQAIDTHPQLMEYAIEQKRLLLLNRQLRADAIPDVSVSAGYLRDNLEGYSAPLIGASLSIPLFNKNRAARKQTELKRQATEKRKAAARNLLEAKVRSRYEALADIDTRIKTLTSTTIPQAEQVFEKMRTYYNAGSVPWSELISAQTEHMELHLELLEIETERACTLTEIIRLTSVPLPIIREEK